MAIAAKFGAGSRIYSRVEERRQRRHRRHRRQRRTSADAIAFGQDEPRRDIR